MVRTFLLLPYGKLRRLSGADLTRFYRREQALSVHPDGYVRIVEVINRAGATPRVLFCKVGALPDGNIDQTAALEAMRRAMESAWETDPRPGTSSG